MAEINPATLASLRRHGWIIFAVLTAGYFFVYFHRVSVSVVGTEMVAEVGGSVGILSSVYFWTYTAMHIPCGIMCDRMGARLSATIFLVIASLGSLITCVSTSFEGIVIGKILIAAGMAVVYVPLMKLVSVWFPKSDFAVLTAVVIAVGNVGAVAAAGPLEMLSEAVGWRDVFLVLGTVTLALAVLCATLVRDHPRGWGLPSVEEVEHHVHGTPMVESSAARIPVLKGLRIVFSGGRRFWTCALAYFLVYGTIMTFQGTWAVTYFNSVYGFALSASWMVTALGIGKIVSTVAIGAMTSRGMIVSKRRAMIAGTSSFAAVWAAIFLLAGDVPNYWFWLCVNFAFGFFGGFMTLAFTQVKEWYPIAVSGTAVSGTNMFLFLGASVFTTISGAVIGTQYTLGNFSELWGMMTVAALAAVALLALSVEKHPEDPPIGVSMVAPDKEGV